MRCRACNAILSEAEIYVDDEFCSLHMPYTWEELAEEDKTIDDEGLDDEILFRDD